MVRIFKNIGIGDLLMAIRRCSSLLRCCRCSMSDVYIGRTLELTRNCKQCFFIAQPAGYLLIYIASTHTFIASKGNF